MKFTCLVPGVAVRADDAEILAAIQKTFAQAVCSHGVEWTMGVRNNDGVVYREVIVDSFDQIPALSSRMSRLGIAEEMEDNGRLIDGYDVTYRNG